MKNLAKIRINKRDIEYDLLLWNIGSLTLPLQTRGVGDACFLFNLFEV